MDRFAAIDGAVMADFSGKVWAIGCIIDSVAAKGTIARGSRYNGTVGFLYQEGRRKGRPVLLALVVSEDGIVDIISSDEVGVTRPKSATSEVTVDGLAAAVPEMEKMAKST